MAGAWPHLDAHGPLHLGQLPEEGRQQGGLSCPHGTNDSEQAALGHREVDPGDTEGVTCP